MTNGDRKTAGEALRLAELVVPKVLERKLGVLGAQRDLAYGAPFFRSTWTLETKWIGREADGDPCGFLVHTSAGGQVLDTFLDDAEPSEPGPVDYEPVLN